MTSPKVRSGVPSVQGYAPAARTRPSVTSKATITKGSNKAPGFDGANPNKVNYVAIERPRPSNGAD